MIKLKRIKCVSNKMVMTTIMLAMTVLSFSNDKMANSYKAPMEKFDPIVSSPSETILSGKTDALTHVNALFQYNQNNIYDVFAKPDYLTTFKLNKDEDINFIGGGDTEGWLLEQTKGGKDGANILLVRPLDSELKTNIVIVTSKRIYQINLVSSNYKYNPFVSWQYPEDEAIAKFKSDALNTEMKTDSIEKLNFKYRISDKTKSWSPVQVFDDSIFTYIQMKDVVKTQELPAFYVLDGNKLDLVNYEIKGDKLIVQRLFEKGVLKLGKDEINIKNETLKR